MCNRNGVAGTIRLFQETGETILVVIVLLSMQQIRPLFAGAAIRRFIWPDDVSVVCHVFICTLDAGNRRYRIQDMTRLRTRHDQHQHACYMTMLAYGLYQ